MKPTVENVLSDYPLPTPSQLTPELVRGFQQEGLDATEGVGKVDWLGALVVLLAQAVLQDMDCEGIR
jgi:hypothetical protein